MAIEFECRGCGQRLRVADRDARKQARCPRCGGVTVAPDIAAAAPIVELPEPRSAAENPYASPASTTGYSADVEHLLPHRGTLVLLVGTLGLVCCLIPSPFAWTMGVADLKKIRDGRMDPSGESTTQAGMVLGMIGTILLGLNLLVAAGFFFFFFFLTRR